MDDDNDDNYKKLNLEGCRVVGVDPGRKDLFVAVDQDEEITKCSTKEYYEIARFRKTREKREVWMNNNKYIQAIVRGKRCNPKIDQSINQLKYVLLFHFRFANTFCSFSPWFSSTISLQSTFLHG